jgi:hypothetical protein
MGVTVTAWHATAGLAVRPESEVLLREIEAYLRSLRDGGSPADLPRAERIAGALRQLIDDTAHACAVDRARVRAAVHYFVARRAATHRRGASVDTGAGPHQRRLERPEPRGWRSPPDRVVNELLCELGRADLVVAPD